MKIVFLDESTINLNGDINYSGLESLSEFKKYQATTTEQEVIDRAIGATHIIVNKVLITDKILNALPKLN